MSTILSIIVLLVGIGMGFVIGDHRYTKFKSLFSDFTGIMNEMNEAMKDDNVSEAEAQRVWDAVLKFYKNIITKEEPVPQKSLLKK